MKSIGHIKNALHTPFTFLTFLGLTFLLVGLFGCAPSSSPEGESKQSSSVSPSSNEIPDLTDEIIRERINQTRVRQIPEENGTSEPISWGFYEEEPKEITVVEKQSEGDRATIVLDIKTGSTPNSRNPKSLAGQIRTEWKLETGWVLRRWEIVKTENISMKFRNLPKPPEQNSNR
jgi:hypothetical protein